MNITALIRENATGEIREFKDTLDVTEDGAPDHEFWSADDYRCDCMRAPLFGTDSFILCGNTAFSVNLRRDDTGEVFYREYEQP